MFPISSSTITLYARAFVNEVELRQAVVDPRSSLNVMPHSTFKVVGFLIDMVKNPNETPGFEGDAFLTLNFVNIDLVVEPI